jgi:predicted nicotinamide N-methyase
MVVVKAVSRHADVASATSELHMESGKIIRYVAPMTLDCTEMNEHQQVVLLAQEKRLLFGDISEEAEKWAGVSDLCQAIDHIVEIEKETELFKGKRILEVGFCTGLPSVYGLEHGAAEATLVCTDNDALSNYIKPTIRKNNIGKLVNYITCDIEQLRDEFESNKYDIILAPELVNTKQEYFEQIHDMLKLALAHNGMIFFSGRTHYNSCDGSMSAMIDLIKSKNTFDVMERSTFNNSIRTETAPRKVVQLMHKMC